MPTRSLSRSGIESRGRRFQYSNRNNGGGTWKNNVRLKETMTDFVGKGNGYDFTVNRWEQNGGLINLIRDSSSTAICFENWRYDQMNIPDNFHTDHLNLTDRPSNAILAAKLLADTNPSRPVVDLPIFVYELKDMPGLLKKEGGSYLRQLASLNLKYHFAIKPLVSDLLSLLDFGDEVNKRQKELENLARSGLRRKRTLWSGSRTGSTSGTFNSNGILFAEASIPKSTVSKVWGFVEWFPESPTMMQSDLRALAKKAVLGLTVDFSTAWNAIPWSWLIDWCSSTGNLLEANRNIVGAKHGPIRIMEHQVTTGSFRARSGTINGDPYEVSPYSYSHTTKTRRTAVASLDAYLPLFSMRQLSILGSIAVTRRKPGLLT